MEVWILHTEQRYDQAGTSKYDTFSVWANEKQAIKEAGRIITEELMNYQIDETLLKEARELVEIGHIKIAMSLLNRCTNTDVLPNSSSSRTGTKYTFSVIQSELKGSALE